MTTGGRVDPQFVGLSSDARSRPGFRRQQSGAEILLEVAVATGEPTKMASEIVLTKFD
jgi:hypothetical protein